MNKYVVYAHYTKDQNKLFYIGEGTLERSKSKFSRNKYWKNKVEKHNGFNIKILYSNLTKQEAEKIEERLIRKCKKKNIELVNLCIGPMYKNHWLAGADKEKHPMFGKKRPDASIRMSNWNKEHSGEKSPTYGKKRPDLTERNKLGLNRKKGKSVRCIETGEIFKTIKEAKKKYPSEHYARAIQNGWAIKGLHWEYFIEPVSKTLEEHHTKVV